MNTRLLLVLMILMLMVLPAHRAVHRRPLTNRDQPNTSRLAAALVVLCGAQNEELPFVSDDQRRHLDLCSLQNFRVQESYNTAQWRTTALRHKSAVRQDQNLIQSVQVTN